MEFPQVGSHCTIDSCKQNDFLPFPCKHCGLIFCKSHFHITSHNCKLCPDNIVQKCEKSINYTCSKESCKSTSPVEMNCVKCERHYCLAHRYHGCLEISDAENAKKLEEWKKPKEDFEAAKNVVDAKINENLRKSKHVEMARKVQLMKLKGKAIGSKSIPTVDRRYFLINPPLSTPKKEARAVFICVRWTIGKTIDSIAEILNIPNSNNLANSYKLKIFHHSTGNVLAEKMDSVLSDLFEHSDLIDGQSLILEYSNDIRIDSSLYQ